MIRMIKSRNIKWVGHVAYMAKILNAYEKARRDLYVGGRIDRIGWYGLD
jgi:hypothetical protein